MTAKDTIKDKIEELEQRKKQEPREYNDRDQEQEWACVHQEIDTLLWVLTLI